MTQHGTGSAKPECFEVGIADGVAHVRLNRPEKLNAMGARSGRSCRRSYATSTTTRVPA